MVSQLGLLDNFMNWACTAFTEFRDVISLIMLEETFHEEEGREARTGVSGEVVSVTE